MNKEVDYYQILQVHVDADPEIIKVSYRTLMQKLKNHPDLGGDRHNAALINEAYAVLSNPLARAKYDAALRVGITRPQPAKKAGRSGQNPDFERIICLFCKIPNVIRKKGAAAEELNCTQCLSPLRFIDFDPQWILPRAARSAKHNMDVSFRLNSRARELMQGAVKDLSPTGMQLLSAYALRMGDIIKLDTPEISAVASVMRCQKAENGYACGVKFLSLKIHNTRGTFVSHKV